MSTKAREYTDPSDYNQHHERFEQEGLPKSQQAWIQRAKEVSDILAEDAAQRDIDNKSPRAEVSLLKSAGLLKVLGPEKYGGGEQSWETGYKVIREVAKGDGSLGMLLGYHLLWSTTANVVGTDEQQESVQQVIIQNNYFVGGAVNPRDSDLKISSEGDEIVFNGFKNFNTGGVVSDLTVLEGVLDGTEDHIFTFVKTIQPGISFLHNWDNVGLRLTESGGVKINDVRVPWSDALGWDAQSKRPVQEVLGIPFASMLLPTIQLVFTNFYLGIAQGALGAASQYTVNSTRAWPYGGDNKDKATDEWYILERYGEYRAHLAAADALTDRAGAEIANLYREAGQYGSVVDPSIAAKRVNPNYLANGIDETGPLNKTNPPYTISTAASFQHLPAESQTNGHANGNGHSKSNGRAGISALRRGEVAAFVAHAKVVTTDTGLAVTSGVFEMLGARATGKKYGFDRYWRDIRTHSLHDPVAYKKREVGRYQLLGEIPEPTWYT
ncbi:Dibenzothiophene desulfurization enzyme C [Fulvia fulva]|uniref:Dibenzothiophene desulfurization enzyme C n=1 Tax=Passalora fulva TaxID=5499 RepID=A0A9Q8LAW2_PASFU|nr:Dibenzothiophene desulfurization enzyme C [Fulvia fulva]KAK4631662.1 Dibenzothiophene desulfurization enzyme C [Fulvia fulva]KAK4633292.1 Dibenzothiophene desulfurization enzyme C [Fulvia fulva]UJO14058.1 Dibenzothiophene desulfurization enzyme C [Fulvia fulva]WPV11683.1 Dibenzothiophene desulfurization enzyme C [Fulvia fulva]WPV26203.1 Dibenzothiophene desulfurization enzyme C [Fulvia fulva]